VKSNGVKPEITEMVRSPRPARRRQQKQGRTPTGIKLNRTEITGIAMMTQKRDAEMAQVKQSMQQLAELWLDRGLDPNKNYFVDQDGSVYIETGS